MNIFHKTALEGLRKNRTRTFVTVIGVFLSATLFTTVATFGTSLLQYLINDSIDKYGGWYIDFVDVDEDFVQERMQDPQVTEGISFENIGYALLDGAKSSEKPYLFLAGFQAETFDHLPVTLISGRLPRNEMEILIPNHISVKAGIRIPIGERLTLAVGRREMDEKALTQHDRFIEGERLDPVAKMTYTVVGIYERAGFEEHDAPGYTVITRADAPQMQETGCYSLFLTLTSPQQVKSYTAPYTDTVPFALNEDVLRFYGVSENRMFNAAMFTVGGILVAIIMIGSVFLIYASVWHSNVGGRHCQTTSKYRFIRGCLHRSAWDPVRRCGRHRLRDSCPTGSGTELCDDHHKQCTTYSVCVRSGAGGGHRGQPNDNPAVSLHSGEKSRQSTGDGVHSTDRRDQDQSKK